MGFRLRPDHKHIRKRRIRYPHLRAAEDVTALRFRRTCFHATRVGTSIGFGQPETANPFAASELGQILHSLLFRAISIDRIHHERRLNAHH